MTSLARQLNNLKVVRVGSILAPQQKRASLLFDPKEAAELDVEHVFALGTAGLEELEQIDPAFSMYRETLFNELNLRFERLMQTQEVNDRLNDVIHDFLIRVSPYYLVRSAHKALEWLVFRYRIHDFNADSLMECILPYHDNVAFIRALRMIAIPQKSRWNWLKPTKEDGLPLNRHTLISQCKKDPALLKFICKMASDFNKVHGNSDGKLRVAIGVLTIILVGCLQARDEISEEMILEVVSFLKHSFKSASMQLRASAYMVSAQLFSEVQVQPQLLDKLLPLMTQKLCDPLFSCGLKCITVVCRSQQLVELPQKCQDHLKNIDHPAMSVLEAYLNPDVEQNMGAEEAMDTAESVNQVLDDGDDEDEEVPPMATLPVEDEVDAADEEIMAVKTLTKKLKKQEDVAHDDVLEALLKSCDKKNMYQVKRKLFRALQPSAQQQQLTVSKLLDVATGSACTQQLVAQRTLSRLKLLPQHLLHEVKGQSPGSEQEKGLKSRRSIRAPLNLKRLRLVLEILAGRDVLEASEELVIVLFDLLIRLDKEDDEEGVYCTEVTLTILHVLCAQWVEEKTPKNQESCKVELVIKCLRSNKPGVQQQALLLLADLAVCFPEYTLHNAMSIFTLMGDTVLYRDDAYTFKTIIKVLDTLIPILLKNPSQKSPKKQRRSTGAASAASVNQQVLQVFVDSRAHIPRHRCPMLFQRLLELLGTQEHAWMLMVQTAEAAVRQRGAAGGGTQEEEGGDKPYSSDLEFIRLVCGQLSVDILLTTCQKLLNFLGSLTKLNANPTVMKDKSLSPLTLNSLSASQLRQIQYLLTHFAQDIMARNDFIVQMVERLSTANDPLLSRFEGLVKETLGYFVLVSHAQTRFSPSAPLSKFWKATLNKIFGILEHVNYLLPNKIFLQIVVPLMQHELVGARKKALEILADKLQQIQPQDLEEEEIEKLLSLTEKLSSMACQADAVAESSQDDVTLRQMALYCMKQITRMIGKQHMQIFAQVLTSVVELLVRCDESQGMLIGSCLLCIGELCTCVKSLALEHFPVFMPKLVQYLRQVTDETSNEVQLNCALSATQKIISCLRNFISPYISDIILQVCQLHALVIQREKRQPSTMSKLKSVCHHLASDVAARVLIPVAKDTAGNILQKDGPEGLTCLLNILTEHIKVISREDLNVNVAELEKFFLCCLDVRWSCQQLSMERRIDLEDSVISMVVTTVSKLSEASFRPLYYKLYDWGCHHATEEHKLRSITFFRLSYRLGMHLKSLFNLFVDPALQPAVDHLTDNTTAVGVEDDVGYFGSGSESSAASCELLNYVLGMLYQCFLHEGEALLTQELFDKLYEPVVHQLENVMGGKEAYQQRFKKYLVPCLTQLALICKDESWLKTLNYQVCLKTRHSSQQVRFASVKVLESMVQKLGENYIPYLQETMPFLAELMEDESEEVEQEVKELVAILENIVSEPLNNYF